MSRSLGDLVGHKCGVSSEPEIIEKDIEGDDCFIILGSDGIWDAMGSTEAVGFIYDKVETGRKENPALLIVEECRNRWELLNLYKQKFQMEQHQNKENQDNNLGKAKEANQNMYSIDDITSIIHFFNTEY